MFRNPRWRPKAGAELVEHLVLAARGVAPREEGSFFAGRRRVLGEIVDWLRQEQPGILVVTGPAGCGKSAVVGRIAALSDADERAGILRHQPLRPDDPDPGEGSVQAALHMRGMDADGIAAALAHRLGLRRPANHWELVADLEQQSRRAAPPAIVLDGLDEAAPDQTSVLVEQLLVPLGRVTRLLLATRERPFRHHDSPASEQPGVAITAQLGVATSVVDLASEPGTADDVAEYVRLRLSAAGLVAGRVEQIAAGLARQAAGSGGGFLLARIVGTHIAAEWARDAAAEWRGELPGTVAAALEQDIDSGPRLVRDGHELPHAARDLLRALAWAQGRGVPARGVWETIAGATSPQQTVFGPADLDWVLGNYGRYIVEDTDGTQAVYRLYHREFIEHLRATAPTVHGQRPAVAVMRALVDLIEQQTHSGQAPGDLNPYLRQHLSAHAVTAGGPGVALLRQLAEASPAAYLPDLAGSLNNLAVRLAEVGQTNAADHAYQEAIDGFGDNAQATSFLRVERAARALRHADQHTALLELVDLLRSPPADMPGQVAMRARRLLRQQAARDREHREGIVQLWTQATGKAPPPWLDISDEHLHLVTNWLNTPSWSDSSAYLREHASALVTGQTDVVLEELALLAPDESHRHQQLLDTIRQRGVDVAYQPLILRETLAAWLATPSWEASQEFLDTHRDELLDEGTDTALATIGGDQHDTPVLNVHRALLHLARTDGIQPAYRCVQDRQALSVHVQAALDQASDATLAHLAVLEHAVFNDPFPAATHHAMAVALSDPAEWPERPEALAAVSHLAAQASAEDRNRAAAETAALLANHPQYAERLNPLLRAILTPDRQ